MRAGRTIDLLLQIPYRLKYKHQRSQFISTAPWAVIGRASLFERHGTVPNEALEEGVVVV